MADYKEQTVEGKSWQRAFYIEGKNNLDGARSLVFHEETAFLVNGEVKTSREGAKLTVPFDPVTASDDVFPLIHPVTGAQIGTMNAMMIYIALSSYYMAKALERDAYVPPAPPVIPGLFPPLTPGPI